jgi:putative ABC transport system permease protein
VLRLQVRELLGHPLRTVVTLAMVAVCSSLAVAVLGLVQSVRTTAEQLSQQVAGTADVEVTSPFGGGTVSDEVVAEIERTGGVAAVAPTVQAPVSVDGERAVLLAGDQRALSFLPDGLTSSLDVAPSDPAAETNDAERPGDDAAARTAPTPSPDEANPSGEDPAGEPEGTERSGGSPTAQQPDAELAGDDGGARAAPTARPDDTGPSGDDLAAGTAPLGPVLVSRPVADELGLGAGDTVDVRGPYGVREAVVGGVLPEEASPGSLLVTDLRTGLALRGGEAGYDRVLVDLDAQADGAREALRRSLDGRAVLVDPAERTRDATEAFRPLVQPLTLLAGLTVTVAGVLVFNVVSVSVAERRRQLAIQCALGGRRRRLWAGLVGEAALLGAVGGALGAALGRRVTTTLVDQVPPALANVAFPTRITVDVPGWLLVAGAAVGLVAAAVAAAVAGRPVIRLSPLEAMGPRDIVGEPSSPPRVSLVAVGVGCMAVGILVVAVGPLAVQTLAALVILDGVVVLVWALRTPLAQVIARAARSAGAPGLLASLAIGRSPARNATTVLGALLPVASVVSLGGLQQNVYDTAHRAYDSLGEPDLYVSAEPLSEATGDWQLPADLARELDALDGVEAVVPARFTFVRVGGGEAYVEGVEPESAAPGVRLASPAARRALFDGGSPDVVVTKALADRLDLERGDRFRLPTAVGAEPVRVADVIELSGWPGGFLAVPYDQLAAWTGSDAPSILEVEVDGPDAERAVTAAVERRAEQAGLDLVLTPGDEAVDEALLSFRQTQTLFTALQGVLMAAGAFAIVSTLVIATLGRTRELGLLRAVGARRRLVRWAVVTEAFVVTLTGAAMGLVVGTVFQFVGVRLAAGAAGFPADFAVTVRPSVTALVAGVVIAGAAAVATLRRILRLDILDAVAYE